MLILIWRLIFIFAHFYRLISVDIIVAIFVSREWLWFLRILFRGFLLSLYLLDCYLVSVCIPDFFAVPDDWLRLGRDGGDLLWASAISRFYFSRDTINWLCLRLRSLYG
jgi:hypothetical protein